MKAKLSSYLVCTLFIFFWGLYGFHWYDCVKGTRIDALSNVFLGINLLICIVCTILLFGKQMPYLFRGVIVLLLTFLLYGTLYIVGGKTHYLDGGAVNKGSYLIGILRSYLPLFAFYYFTIKGALTPKSIKLYFIILFIFCILYNLFFSRYWISMGYESGFTNNLGYVFVSFFPFVFLYKEKPILQNFLVALIVGLTIASMKRGAILISLLLLFYYFYLSFRGVSTSKRFLYILLFVGLLVVGYRFVIYIYDSSAYFQIRVEQTIEGESSGRDVLYTRLVDHYLDESSWIQQLFGAGADSTLDIIGKEAHNDWLEILTCQGLFGVIVFAVFWFYSFRYWRRMPKNSYYFPIVGSVLITLFLRSLFSMSYSTIPTGATLILGYSLAMNELQVKMNA